MHAYLLLQCLASGRLQLLVSSILNQIVWEHCSDAEVIHRNIEIPGSTVDVEACVVMENDGMNLYSDMRRLCGYCPL